MLFKNNKYTAWYMKLMLTRKNRIINEYTEKHHIIPKSMGGKEGDNLVALTPKEHFIAHLLLTKMTEGTYKHRMNYAFNMMLTENRVIERYKPTSRFYAMARKLVGEAASNINKGKTAWNKGIPRPQYVKDAVSNANKGRKAWNKGVPRTEEDKEKMKIGIAKRGPRISPTKGSVQPTFYCIHCSKKIAGKSNYVRWHDNNCLRNPDRKDSAKRVTNFSINNPSKIKMKCQYCGQEVPSTQYKKLHGDNCKIKEGTNEN